MYYTIQEDRIEETARSIWENSEDGIGVFTTEEWNEELELRNAFSLNQSYDNIHFCKLETHASYLFGTFRVPVKKEHEKNHAFAVYILEHKIIFVDGAHLAETLIRKIAERKIRKDYCLERFLYDFLMCLVEDDLLYLAEIEHGIARIEEDVLRGKTNGFNIKMLAIKKEISRLYRYYSQLTEVGEELCENSMEYFGKEDIRTYDIFAGRASRLQSETQVLREYAMQVQEVYQSEIGIRQNDIMKVLTIVTTIFLPLTLIAGWYGMNFYNMPELTYKYGYAVVIGISILVIVLSLWIFKKKKYI